ncbi:metallopeptidase family protein [Brachybacterium sp. JHP9]|uniref:Metallopeptidase family protein n=1 Tax=Brachybacterium equifaecis TaxID=2910770 RepID=A0ABT0R1Z7_9MICO|nr:metallopeptidase family protein [Brachybacterium equifaecis]MCL6423952.1 metallopeptidase family protein [Brachybacterium equifaecis]
MSPARDRPPLPLPGGVEPSPGAIARRSARRRDRHGRGWRRDLVPGHLPGHRTHRDIFDDAVLDAARPLLERFPRPLEHLEIAVEDVPLTDPAPWEAGAVTLGRLFPSDRDHPPRLVLYRRPIETRSEDPEELALMVRQVLCDQIASMLGMAPEDVDPDAWPD